MENFEKKQFAINTIKKADLDSCNLNQLITILNLYHVLNIPSVESDSSTQDDEGGLK